MTCKPDLSGSNAETVKETDLLTHVNTPRVSCLPPFHVCLKRVRVSSKVSSTVFMSCVAKSFKRKRPEEYHADCKQGRAQKRWWAALGDVFYEEKKYRHALIWLLKAKDLPVVQNLLGMYCSVALGDQHLAIKWYSKAADNDLGYAQFNLGATYKEVGEHILALFWLYKSTTQGDPDGQCELGYCYKDGACGLKKDYIQAFSWFMQAAQQEHALSQYEIGLMYFRGYVVEKDVDQALTWFQKAAAQKSKLASYGLGTWYAKHGTFLDYNLARYWFQKADEYGDVNAAKEIKTLLKKHQIQQEYEKRIAKDVKQSNTHRRFTLELLLKESYLKKEGRDLIPIILQYVFGFPSEGFGTDDFAPCTTCIDGWATLHFPIQCNWCRLQQSLDTHKD